LPKKEEKKEVKKVVRAAENKFKAFSG